MKEGIISKPSKRLGNSVREYLLVGHGCLEFRVPLNEVHGTRTEIEEEQVSMYSANEPRFLGPLVLPRKKSRGRDRWMLTAEEELGDAGRSALETTRGNA
jgi:hypothetical protein